MITYRVTLDRVAMAAKWDENLNYAWNCKGSAACLELLQEADEALEQAQELEAAGTILKIVQDGRESL